MEAIGGLFSFLGQIVDQRTMVILDIIKHAATRWVTWSASVINLVYEFWQQGQTSSANLENIVGSDGTLCLPGTAGKTSPPTHEEDTVSVVNDKDSVGDKEDTSTRDDEKEEEAEDEAPQGVDKAQKRRRRAKNAHNGVGKSSKRKGAKGRAAYTLRGVAGEVAKPAGA